MRKVFLIVCLSAIGIFAMGNSLFRVTDFPGHELTPRVSPDGTRLAFTDVNTAGPRPVSFIRVATHNGLNPMVVTNTGSVDNQYPSWSPEGNLVAYERLIAVGPGVNTYEIWSVPISSVNGARLIQNNNNFNVMGSVSKNGDIAFVTSGNEKWPFQVPPLKYGGVPPPANKMGMFFIAVQKAGNPVILNGPPGLFPRWSPDGKQLAYCAWNPATGWDVFVADYDSYKGIYNLRALTAEPGDEFAPCWSPNGQWIAYAYSLPLTPKPINIFTINIHDHTLMQVTFEARAAVTSPDWAVTADGEHIYVSSDIDGDFDIYRLTPLIAATNQPQAPQKPLPPNPGIEANYGDSPSSSFKYSGSTVGKVEVIVLNTSTNKRAPEAQLFARQVGKRLMEWNDEIWVSNTVNGHDTGEPRVFYVEDEYKDLANEIAKFIDRQIVSGKLTVNDDMIYEFFPAEPISKTPYIAKTAKIIIEAPANSVSEEESEEETETEGEEETDTGSEYEE